MKEEIIERASELADLAPRQLENERKAADLIEKEVEAFGPEIQRFQILVPDFQDWGLKADGEEIECLPSGLESGKIRSKALVNSILNGQGSMNRPNISFNPYAEGISVPNFYEAPSVAISPEDVEKVVEANEVEGYLEVEWESHQSRNILVGNSEDPDRIVMTHYDSVWGGFIDNGFTVSLLIQLLDELDLEENLIVFAGAEEISQESPYHCYGYRRFEDEYIKQIQEADEIFLADSLGRNTQKVIKQPEIVEKAIVLNRPGYREKVRFVASEYHEVLDIYHSPEDTKQALNSYEEALELVRKELGL
ncbi:hypothetical protein AQV86_01845 [Nanohaloarchaea archaeon SG9]|nr:hypothetical protein AQV86_01845 [Nanohaloarchaea archaeon SG9]